MDLIFIRVFRLHHVLATLSCIHTHTNTHTPWSNRKWQETQRINCSKKLFLLRKCNKIPLGMTFIHNPPSFLSGKAWGLFVTLGFWDQVWWSRYIKPITFFEFYFLTIAVIFLMCCFADKCQASVKWRHNFEHEWMFLNYNPKYGYQM